MAKPTEPSLEEIRSECLKIQETWSESEEWKRRGFEAGRPFFTVLVARIIVDVTSN
jgi:hypothetical protein